MWNVWLGGLSLTALMVGFPPFAPLSLQARQAAQRGEGTGGVVLAQDGGSSSGDEEFESGSDADAAPGQPRSWGGAGSDGEWDSDGGATGRSGDDDLGSDVLLESESEDEGPARSAGGVGTKRRRGQVAVSPAGTAQARSESAHMGMQRVGGTGRGREGAVLPPSLQEQEQLALQLLRQVPGK